MPRTTQEILVLADKFEKIAKDKPKLDPKAKVRNRGTVCVPASSAKDHKDHFPINDEDQARNALARVHQYDKVPPWYSGSLKGLQQLVSRKVHSKYPSIGKSEKKKSKKSSLEEMLNTFIRKTAELGERVDANLTGQQILDKYPGRIDLADLDDMLNYGEITETQFNQLRDILGRVDYDPEAVNTPANGPEDYEVNVGPRQMEFHTDSPSKGSVAPQGSGVVGKSGFYPPIPKDVQNSLNYLMQAGLKVDGKLGPQTRKALDNFKTRYKMQGATDSAVFQAIRQATQGAMNQGAAMGNATNLANFIQQVQQFIQKAQMDMQDAISGGKGLTQSTLQQYANKASQLQKQLQSSQQFAVTDAQKNQVDALVSDLGQIQQQLSQVGVRPTATASRLMNKLIEKYGQ